MSPGMDASGPDAAAEVQCPYCGADVSLSLDSGGGAVQRYVEDCAVCCRPWEVTVRYDYAGRAEVLLETADE
jgi:hypothetical protein